jgi:group I intron endonuclease
MNYLIQEQSRYIFVYQTKNIINGKIYIGVHSTTNLEDGYIGNSIYRQSDVDSRKEKVGLVAAVRKYGYENFKRDILKFFDTEEEAYLYEAELVTEEFVVRNNNYNIAVGGRGGNTRAGFTEEQMIDYKRKLSEGVLRAKDEGRGFTEQHSDETIEKLSIIQKEKMKEIVTDEYRNKLSSASKESWKNRKSYKTIIVIDGIEYESKRSAANILGIGRGRLNTIIKNQ